MHTTISYIQQHLPELSLRLQEQLYLILVPLFIAIIIGVVSGLVFHRLQRLKQAFISITGALWTIPSLALLAFLIPILGIGKKPAIIALTFYAFLPIVRTTISGLENVSKISLNSAQALGFSQNQSLCIIQFPLALPAIMSGIRTAAVMLVGIATLAAFVGAGGLGDFINRGLAVNDNRLILLGAIPSAILALVLDISIAKLATLITPQRIVKIPRAAISLTITGLIGIIAGYLLLTTTGLLTKHNIKQNSVIIASKNFTEQFILAELMAQMIEAKTELSVIRKFNLGTTQISHQAMLRGEIDIYPEYTGTAFFTVLPREAQNKLKMTNSAGLIPLYPKLNEYYQHNYQIQWLKPFGFNNQQVLTISKDCSQRYKIQTISDLSTIAERLTVAAPPEFSEREDSLPGLQQSYKLHFAAIKSLDSSLVYQAIEQNQADVVMTFSTDNRIQYYGLQPLIDDKNFFPSYQAAPLIRMTTLQKHPELANALRPLLGLIDEKTMRQLNYQVDIQKKSPAIVAKKFLLQKKLLS